MNYLLTPEEVSGNPTFFYTIAGNVASEKVIRELQQNFGGNGLIFKVLEEAPYKVEGFSRNSVAFWDGKQVSNAKRHRRKSERNFTTVQKERPVWTQASYWHVSVAINIDHTRAKDCANQVYAWFQRTSEYLDQGKMPWGETKKGTIVLNGNVPQIQPGKVIMHQYESSLGFFQTFENYQVKYPQVVVDALCELYLEYNAAFAPLIEENHEWETDYKYCFQNGGPVNFGIQIDMLGLTDQMLQNYTEMSVQDVKEILRTQIFEMENSLAMYQLLQSIGGEESFFKTRFRFWLDDIRNRTGKKIAILAVTEGKAKAMLETEFGYEVNIPDEEVYRLTGFDKFFGPTEFLEHLDSSGGQSDYLLVCRTSDPVAKLKDPKHSVDHPLLSRPEIRRIIKECSLTLNVDAPDMDYESRINDTKEYMLKLGMANEISSVGELENLPFESNQMLRAKPAKLTYGCYGHHVGRISEQKFLESLSAEIAQRGKYIIQPEMKNSLLATPTQLYVYIDRVFFAIVNGKPMFLGGFRNMLPASSEEVRKGRIHGNGVAVWVPIVV